MLYQPGGWVIALSFIVAFLLTSIPLPAWLEPFHPDWLCLVLIYWCIALPQRVGMGTAFVLGVLQDVARGTLLGQHALALVVVAYLSLKFHRRLRLFPLWQQCLSVLVLLAIEQLLVAWVSGISGYPPRDVSYLAPALGGMLVWPWVFILLRDLRQRFRIA
ncbi:MAG: rod shape-determining protein MreD [Candidatus Competibacteraceae bacterium]